MSLDQVVDRLEKFILEKMSETNIPGLSISLIAEGRPVYAKAFGFRSIEDGLAATPRTLYGIGSVTKSFTALAVMQLAEEGLLSIDDEVEKHVPVRLRPFGEPVRLWHLMTHSSGVPALAYAEAVIRGAVGEESKWIPIASFGDMAAFLRDASEWAVARPGERFYYLNEGYVLLGYVVERVSGMKYGEYIRRRILEPIGMERTYLKKSEVERDPDVAVPYVVTREGEKIPSRYPYGITSDGGLISNVLDLSRYVSMYLNKGAIDGVRVLSREGIEEMTKPRIRVPYEMFGGEAYGLGWRITPSFLGHKLVGHGGSVLVSTAYVGFIPEKKMGAVLLANGSGYPLSYMGMYALALLLGRDPEELPFVAYERLLGRLEGRYSTYRETMLADVARRGDLLYLEYGGKYTRRSIPLVLDKVEGDTAIFYTIISGRRLPVEFRIKKHGTELIYERYKFVKIA